MAETPARIPEGDSYIGRSIVRPQAARLLAGRGQFTDDLRLPRMLHAAFLRCPHAHARVVSVDARATDETDYIRRMLRHSRVHGCSTGSCCCRSCGPRSCRATVSLCQLSRNSVTYDTRYTYKGA